MNSALTADEPVLFPSSSGFTCESFSACWAYLTAAIEEFVEEGMPPLLASPISCDVAKPSTSSRGQRIEGSCEDLVAIYKEINGFRRRQCKRKDEKKTIHNRKKQTRRASRNVGTGVYQTMDLCKEDGRLSSPVDVA